VRRTVSRAVAIGALVMLAYGGAELVHFRAFCGKHLAWLRRQHDPAAVVVDDGFAVARAGDAIFTCETDHCFGIGGCHVDLGCYCAAASLSADAVAQLLDARSCVVDHLAPAPTDATGACRYAHCDDHIGP